MKLKIHGKIPEGETFKITICGESKILDSLNHTVIFDSLSPGNYTGSIEQVYRIAPIKWFSVLLFVFTAVFRGVFHILLMDIDTAWEKNIRAFLLKVTLQIVLQEDMELIFSCSKSQYKAVNHCWEPPAISISTGCKFQPIFLENPRDFRVQYIRYIKKILSLASVIGGVFCLLFYFAIVNQNNVAVFTVSALFLGLIILTILLCMYNHKKLVRLYCEFLVQITKS